MNKIKNNKNFIITPVAVTLFFFLRSLLLTDRRYIGFEDLYTFETSFSGENIALVTLLTLFAVLSGLVISKIGKKFGEAATFLSVLLVAEPFLFAKQMNCVVVFIADLALLFILNALCNKRIIPNEVTLIVFLFVSCLLTENAIFLFVLPAVILYFIGDAENIFKSTKKLVMLILSVISVGAGILTNDYLIGKYPAFDEFIKSYSFYKQIYFKHIDYENVLLFVFAVPATAFGIYFLVEFVKNCNSNGKNARSYVVIGMISAAYVLLLVGFFLRGSDAFFTVNYVMPLSVFALIANKNVEAEKSLDKANAFVSKHTLAFVVVAVFLCFLSTVTFYRGIDNLAGFILTI